MIGHAWPGGKDVVKLGVPSLDDKPKIEAEEEVRLAVVLYGGSSLCIYMNGVAQELLRLVRATAGETFDPDTTVAFPGQALDGTEQVYRHLAQLGTDDPGTHEPRDTLRRRFVIDILTGSSAGGINGIFLAKALANNQSLDQLKQLWIEKGDIVQLYNDGKHSKDVHLKPERPPKSLLDGRWMYANLVTALDGMSPDPDPPVSSPLVRELDLFVTATDLYGLPVSIRLANGAAVERKHRQVFHFRYGTKDTEREQNNFLAANNPFLAFTARCTSSLPFIFQPMTLGTVDQLLPHVPNHSVPSDPSQNRDWASFYLEYGTEESPDPSDGDRTKLAMGNFIGRPFGDGGSLDNSPFTFATEMLAHRRGELPVSRKLLYLEPDPVTEEGWDLPPELPDAGQNFLMQFVTLPRSQTVSEDLHALKDRNRVIRRVQEALAAAEPVFKQDGDGGRPELLRTPDELVKQYGQVYVAYRRLKVASVVDDLATFAVRAGGLEPASDEWGAVRALVDAWRQQEFGDDDKQFDAFLTHYDLGFRLRKVTFVERVASEVDRAVTWKRAHPGRTPDPSNDLVVRGLKRLPRAKLGDLPDDDEWLTAFQKELREARKHLSDTGNALWRARTDVSDGTEALREAIVKSEINRKAIRGLLDRSRTAEELFRNAGEFVQHYRAGFQEIGIAMREHLDGVLADHAKGSSAEWRDRQGERLESASPNGARQAVECLCFYFDNYEPYDMLVLPIIYGTDAGESAPVEIFRISPVDAPSLGDWDLSPKSHVAGNRYSHFGAFLEKVWRQNDVMWGRMDAAGCIIDALMPDYKNPEERKAVRDRLIKEAHSRIVQEELGETGRQTLTNMVLDELARLSPTPKPNPKDQTATARTHEDEVNKAVAEVMKQVADAQSGSRLQQLLVASVGDAKLLDYVTRTQQTEWRLPPADELVIATRGAHVLGEVLKGMSTSKGALAKPGAWISLVGRLGSGVAEVAVTRSIGHLLRWHWLALVLTFAGLTIVGGLVTSTPTVTQFGLMALLATVLAAGAVWSMSQFSKSRRWWMLYPMTVLLVVVGGLMALGVVELAHLGKQHSWIPVFGQATPARSPSSSPTP